MVKLPGIFITFEGIDGCGKSTQARMLYRFIRKEGYPAEIFREPGGTPVSERVRRVLLDRRNNITPLTELFLYEAARAQLAAQKILPALRMGKIVICDRYYDSTTAYQGYGRGIDLNLVNQLNRRASLGRVPDLTFVFDVDYQTSLARRKRAADRLEKEKKAFFNRVRRGFRELARQRRVVLLDGRQPPEAVFKEVAEYALRLVGRRKRRLV
jgi:dTMP kinase